MAYGSNPWDQSNILLNNQSGALMGAGLQQMAASFARGIQSYQQNKQLKEKEDATVAWIEDMVDSGEAAQLIPQLVQITNPAERTKAIRAGIKGAGLDNLIRVRQMIEQAEGSELSRRVTETQLNEAELRQREAQRQAASREQLQRVLAATGNLEGGVGRGVYTPEMQRQAGNMAALPGPVRTALGAGIDDPRVLDIIGRYGAQPEAPFVPRVIDVGDNVTAMTTSAKSAVPLQKQAPKPSSFTGGPEYSQDEKFYRTAPGAEWKAVPREGPDNLDPMVVGSVTERVTALEAETREHQMAISKGDKRYGLNLRSRETRLQEINKQLAGLRATLRGARTSGNTPAAGAAPAGADAFSTLQW